MNPRSKMMLAIGYGCMSGVNAGQAYVTQNIMTLNYTAWIGLAWNGVHAFKWAMLDKHLRLWDGVEGEGTDAIERVIDRIDSPEAQVERFLKSATVHASRGEVIAAHLMRWTYTASLDARRGSQRVDASM